MENAFGFLQSIVKHWVAVMSGIASILMSVVAYLAKWSAVPPKVFLGAGFLCLFYACFAAWKGEHTKLLELKRSHEHRLEGSILEMIGVELKGQTVFTATIEIRNLGAPTIADEYEMSVGSEDTKGQGIIPSSDTILNFATGTRLFKTSDCIANKTTLIPMSTGSKVVGWFWIRIADMKPTDLYDKDVTLRFKDVARNEYLVKFRTPRSESFIGNPFIPGMTT